MNFGLKNASGERNFKSAFTKMCLSLVCLEATSFGEAQIGLHITPGILSQFVQFVMCCYLKLKFPLFGFLFSPLYFTHDAS